MNENENKSFFAKIAEKVKSESLTAELLRYCVAGGTAFVCDTLTLWIFNYLILPDMGRVCVFGAPEGSWFDWDIRLAIATALGFIVGLIVNYLVSIYFVFIKKEQKERGKNLKAFMIFTVVGVIGFILTVAGVQLGCKIAGLDPNEKSAGVIFVRAVVAVIVFAWNYVGRKFLIYKGK